MHSVGVRHPGAPTEALFLADCLAGHTGCRGSFARLTFVLWSERRCAAACSAVSACSCCVVVSAYFVRRDDPSATDWPGGTAERCATHCVIMFWISWTILAACFECFLFLSLALYHWTHWVYYE